ncbi:MAG: cytochrome c [Alphaproteobacteria bacterium]|nr:cytochrome c [Alphaproteobacteria bacterium]
MTLLLLLAACGREVCEPNATRVCYCPGAAESAQVCDADGAGWGPCACGGDDTSGSTTDDTDGGALDGQALYTRHCATCHGPDGAGTSAGPDIREEVFEEPIDELVEVMQEGEDDMPPTGVTAAEGRAIAQWMRATFTEPDDDDDEVDED